MTRPPEKPCLSLATWRAVLGVSPLLSFCLLACCRYSCSLLVPWLIASVSLALALYLASLSGSSFSLGSVSFLFSASRPVGVDASAPLCGAFLGALRLC